jgi:TIR domain
VTKAAAAYDAFISYAAPDLAHAEKLAGRLVAAGLRVFLLEWVEPGEVEAEAKEDALIASTNGVLIFSHATMVDPEIRDDYAALLRRIRTGGRRLIPVRVDDVALPAFAAIRKHVELHTVDLAEYDRRVATLIHALRPADTATADGRQSTPSHSSGRGWTRTEIRMGFAVDIVQYSARSAPMKEDAQNRLARLAAQVLDDLAVDPAETAQQSIGDGMNVFLPMAVEVHRALPALLHSWNDRLSADNRRFQDRLRLRMAAAVGPVGTAAMGFTGGTIVELSRLLDSDVLRKEIAGHPDLDLAVLISGKLYDYVVSEGHPSLGPEKFQRHLVSVKEFSADAWLWTG